MTRSQAARLAQEVSEGFFPLFGRLCHALEEDRRAFNWRRLTGTINFPPPRLLGIPSPLHHERIVSPVKFFTHAPLDGDGVLSFKPEAQQKSLPSASAPKTDKQTGARVNLEMQ
jgi:hypothetical protein